MGNQGRQHPYAPVALQDEKPKVGVCHLANKWGLLTEKKFANSRVTHPAQHFLLIKSPTDTL